MSIHTSPIYRILIPKFIRKRILAKQLRASILSYYANLPEVPSEELAVVLDYLKLCLFCTLASKPPNAQSQKVDV